MQRASNSGVLQQSQSWTGAGTVVVSLTPKDCEVRKGADDTQRRCTCSPAKSLMFDALLHRGATAALAVSCATATKLATLAAARVAAAAQPQTISLILSV